jgi:hypothetical protein
MCIYISLSFNLTQQQLFNLQIMPVISKKFWEKIKTSVL